MATRLELQGLLEELLGSKEVYYQPPESIKMNYPAIVYSIDDIESTYANDNPYNLSNKYQLIVIDKLPDNSVINKILRLPMSNYERNYKSDNLNHDVISLYF